VELLCDFTDEGQSTVTFTMPPYKDQTSAQHEVLVDIVSGKTYGCDTLAELFGKQDTAKLAGNKRRVLGDSTDDTAFGFQSEYCVNKDTAEEECYVVDCVEGEKCTISKVVVTKEFKEAGVTLEKDAGARRRRRALRAAETGRQLQEAVALCPDDLSKEDFAACTCSLSVYCNPDVGYTKGTWIMGKYYESNSDAKADTGIKEDSYVALRQRRLQDDSGDLNPWNITTGQSNTNDTSKLVQNVAAQPCSSPRESNSQGFLSWVKGDDNGNIQSISYCENSADASDFYYWFIHTYCADKEECTGSMYNDEITECNRGEPLSKNLGGDRFVIPEWPQCAYLIPDSGYIPACFTPVFLMETTGPA